MANSSKKNGMSQDTKTIIVVLLLIFFFPIGLVLMWFWVKWPIWAKILISVPVLFFGLILVGLFGVATLTFMNPPANIQKARCVSKCETSVDKTACIQECGQK